MNGCIDLANEQASEQFAQRLASCLTPALVLTFSGEIGTGKTTLIRAMLRSLGVGSAIKSPTFSLIETYQCTHFQVHHFDLYRIHDVDELDYIGFRDYFSSSAICCIEWPEQAGNRLGLVDIAFTLTIKGVGREMHINAFSPAGAAVLSCLLAE